MLINKLGDLKNWFAKKENRILAGLMGAIGLASSCIIGSTEYGMPYAEFKITGTVKDSESGLVIPGIQTKLYRDNLDVNFVFDSTYTTATGEFSVKYQGTPVATSLRLTLRDIDGARNGNYKPIDTVINFTASKLTGGDNKWFEGREIIKVDLKLQSIPQ